MDEETLRRRAALWRQRAIDTLDPAARKANALLAQHYENMADNLARQRRDAPQ